MSLERPCIHWNDGYCKKFSDGEVESWCVDGPCKYEQPSNADRIRAMSDGKLAEYLVALVDDEFRGNVIYSKQEVDWIEWLKQPAEGE